MKIRVRSSFTLYRGELLLSIIIILASFFVNVKFKMFILVVCGTARRDVPATSDSCCGKANEPARVKRGKREAGPNGFIEEFQTLCIFSD